MQELEKNMVTRSEHNQTNAVKHFWNWFAANAKRLEALYAGQQFEILSEEIGAELDKVEPQLAWEIGPGVRELNLLTISAEGNPHLRPLADLMTTLAPHLPGWEFYSARPARPAPASVRLPESGETFQTGQWEFIPIERPRSGRLDLVIVDEQLALSDRETALKAVSIYLDQSLGEDTVEEWIGEFTVQGPLAVHGEKKFKISELLDYLLWATYRGANPLKHHRVN